MDDSSQDSMLTLLRAAQQGDPHAFGELALNFEERLFRQALFLCGNAAQAEDLAQETLFTAWLNVFMIGGLRFRLLVGRWTPDHPEAVHRREGAVEVLQFLDEQLAEDEFLVGGRYTIADIAVYGYSHRAEEAQLDLEPYPNLRAWFERVESQPGYMEDVEPYGANAAPGAGQSIYG